MCDAMAKPLRTDPPSSSVARLLDPSAAARATSRPCTGQPETPHLGVPLCSTSRVDTPALIKREFILTPAANVTLDRLIDLYRRGTRTRLAASYVLRAVLLVIRDALDALAVEVADLPPTKLPGNARGCDADRQRFEQMLADCLRTALRRRLPP